MGVGILRAVRDPLLENGKNFLGVLVFCFWFRDFKVSWFLGFTVSWFQIFKDSVIPYYQISISCLQEDIAPYLRFSNNCLDVSS